MDMDASPEEAAAEQDRQAADQQYLENAEREIAEAKGEGDYNIFDGVDKHRAQFEYTEPEMERYRRREAELRATIPDFEEVVAYATEQLGRTSGIWPLVRHTKDPAWEAYALGLKLKNEKIAQQRAKGYQPRNRALTQDEVEILYNDGRLGEALEIYANDARPTEELDDDDYFTEDELRFLADIDDPTVFENCLNWRKANRGR
jgi:hypothetical protein